MSGTLCVYAYRPKDEHFNEMLKIWNACKKAKVELPGAVEDFFDEVDDPNTVPGVPVDIDKLLQKYSNDAEDGYELDLQKLPKDIRYIRVSFS